MNLTCKEYSMKFCPKANTGDEKSPVKIHLPVGCP
jgi:hypothetical protein